MPCKFRSPYQLNIARCIIKTSHSQAQSLTYSNSVAALQCCPARKVKTCSTNADVAVTLKRRENSGQRQLYSVSSQWSRFMARMYCDSLTSGTGRAPAELAVSYADLYESTEGLNFALEVSLEDTNLQDHNQGQGTKVQNQDRGQGSKNLSRGSLEARQRLETPHH